MQQNHNHEQGTQRKVVILLHGFAAHWSLMSRLASHFKQADYEAINWGYRSWFKSIDYHATRLHERIQQINADETVQSINFVTHSMGCIVTRAALDKGLPQKAQRWVMLAPPNKGSYVANRCPAVIRSWMKPIDELQATDGSYVNQIPIPRVDIAVIQASRDFIVAAELTKIETEKDRLVVPGLHSQMLFRQDVARRSLHFLEHGRFHPSHTTDVVHQDNS